jgi:hypothetical protein
MNARAGNLDILNCSAIAFAESKARIQQSNNPAIQQSSNLGN